jgi:hypothetical protein
MNIRDRGDDPESGTACVNLIPVERGVTIPPVTSLRKRRNMP